MKINKNRWWLSMHIIDESIVNEITEYIEERSLEGQLPEVIKRRIKNVFDLTEEEANKAYSIWKKKYMRARVKS